MGFELALAAIAVIALGLGGFAVLGDGWRKRGCPACGKTDPRWTYARKDGERDQRYSFNPRFCPACGWSSVRELDDSVDPALTLTVSAGGAAVVPVAVRNNKAWGDSAEETHLIAAAIERIARQSGPAARRDALDNALREVTSTRGQQALIDQASRIEVHTVITQARRLPPARREQKIVDALERLTSDPYDDALQREAIALLKRVLADARAPLPDTATWVR